MSLTEEQISLVETTFQALTGKGDAFVVVVYEKLFQKLPEAREIFKNTDFTKQRQKLFLSLMMIVDNLRDMPHIESMLQATVKTHDKYTILPAHFSAFVDALMETFDNTLNDEWSSEAENAWRLALGQIVAMLQTAEI